MQPPHVSTEETRRVAMVMAAHGTPQRLIARALGIDEKTLRKHYRDELDDAKEQAVAKVADTLYRMATSGRTPAATFFWLKTQAGWRETEHYEVTGKGGGPVQHQHEHYNFDNLSREEARELDRLLTKAESSSAE